MTSVSPPFIAPAARHPILWVLASFPIACFSGALATDIAYATTEDVIWADFSTWLLAAGMLMGVLAAIVACVDALAHRHDPSRRPAWSAVIGGAVVLMLGLLNNFVHSRDAWTSVVPQGLVLSAITVLVMLVTMWLGMGKARVPVGRAGYVEFQP